MAEVTGIGLTSSTSPHSIRPVSSTSRTQPGLLSINTCLKKPGQIPVEALTDSKLLWESLHNTRQCEEKLLRNSIAGIKELMDLKMVEDVYWVPTHKQLADCMTKRGKNSDWLLKVARNSRLD